MQVVVRVCSAADLDVFDARAEDPRVLRRHRERFALQQARRGWHLLAWDGDRLVGHVTVTIESKYDEVRSELGTFPEMNALAATPQGQGIGTKLIEAGETLVVDAPIIGLAVEKSNPRARALYERLGYADWGGGPVFDEWVERDGAGNSLAVHRDECDYLVKRLAR